LRTFELQTKIEGMGAPTKSYLAPAVVTFATLAVAFAGIGGIVAAEPDRNLFAAGAGFWLLMLLVPWTFASTKEWPRSAHSGVAAAFGALVGACVGLCFAPATGLSGLFSHTAAGAFIGFVGYWLALIRSWPFRRHW
jgi:hypothetical protein